MAHCLKCSCRRLLAAILVGIALPHFSLHAQEAPRSIHQIESEYYNAYPDRVERPDPARVLLRRPDLMKRVALSRVVYGFHPYWISDASAAAYYYSLLTHVAYFSAEVDTSVNTTGGFSTTRAWSSTQVVNYCKSYGVKIHLTITMFYKHDRVLKNNTNRQNLITNIISQINLRSADGVNIDFENMSSSDQALADSFRTFIYQLGTSLKAIGKELVVELPAVDWSNRYFVSNFFSQNNSVVDYYFLMAYDYYWSGSTTAGPGSPLTTGTAIWHVTRSIDTYLNRGASASKLIAGFPYYGYDWPVVSDTRMASTTGTGTSRTYNTIRTYVDTISSSNWFFDSQYNVPWYRYQSGGNWRQTWYDDSLSLSRKYDTVNVRAIAGSGMWALG